MQIRKEIGLGLNLAIEKDLQIERLMAKHLG